jgi:hypothetical protein
MQLTRISPAARSPTISDASLQGCRLRGAPSHVPSESAADRVSRSVTGGRSRGCSVLPMTGRGDMRILRASVGYTCCVK